MFYLPLALWQIKNRKTLCTFIFDFEFIKACTLTWPWLRGFFFSYFLKIGLYLPTAVSQLSSDKTLLNLMIELTHIIDAKSPSSLRCGAALLKLMWGWNYIKYILFYSSVFSPATFSRQWWYQYCGLPFQISTSYIWKHTSACKDQFVMPKKDHDNGLLHLNPASNNRDSWSFRARRAKTSSFRNRKFFSFVSVFYFSFLYFLIHNAL